MSPGSSPGASLFLPPQPRVRWCAALMVLLERYYKEQGVQVEPIYQEAPGSVISSSA
ncbi:hypothetical protein MANAM107_25090 [Actinomyces capricornis]|uniref:Uncharacterized protein n=1 Tax=Actinomyces capricornis TaxID=2755559 RepID=A0ABM7UEV0_9ACTO|nr:hypothetical protein MANAM107_25090 [Actinomyces capricornis]